jgi:hypothetical protein
MTPTTVGIAALAIPLFLGGLLFFSRNRAVFLFYLAMVAVGIGYLTSTGAVDDIGAIALEKAGMTAPPAATPAPAPSP